MHLGEMDFWTLPCQLQGKWYHLLSMTTTGICWRSFRRNGDEVFKGGTDLMKAESWIDIMKKAFKAMSSTIAIRLDWRPVSFKRKHLTGGSHLRSSHLL